MEETKVLLDDSMFEKLDDSEKNTEFIAMESKTYLQDAWRCFKKNKLALGGLVVPIHHDPSGHFCTHGIPLYI